MPSTSGVAGSAAISATDGSASARRRALSASPVASSERIPSTATEAADAPRNCSL